MAKEAHPIETDPRWQTVLQRDGTADDRFVYSVASTGIYCRPSCPSRRPAPRHVAFHATPADARACGFRPCKRCTPDTEAPAVRQKAAILRACERIAALETPPVLAHLARDAGLSPHHFHRAFRATVGLTPRAYFDAVRGERLRKALRQEMSVTGALYDAGFAAPSRFYAQSDAILGMRPSAYRKGGAAMTIHFACGQAALGQVLVAQSARGICAILMGDDCNALEADLHRRFPAAEIRRAGEDFAATLDTVLRFLDSPGETLSLPLDIAGTAFQQRVWQALRTIPAGTTVSYAELAEKLGAPKAVRAIAGACAANPVAVGVPCHRVVRSDGGLSGYRWGVARKRALLAREGATLDGEG